MYVGEYDLQDETRPPTNAWFRAMSCSRGGIDRSDRDRRLRALPTLARNSGLTVQ